MSQEVGMPLGDIGAILKKAQERRIQVSIALNLRETAAAAQYYTERWKLTHLHNLYQIYEEIKDDIGFFVKLFRLPKAAGTNEYITCDHTSCNC